MRLYLAMKFHVIFVLVSVTSYTHLYQPDAITLNIKSAGFVYTSTNLYANQTHYLCIMGQRLWKTHSSKTLGWMELSSCLATPNKKVWAAERRRALFSWMDSHIIHDVYKTRAQAARIRASERRWISRSLVLRGAGRAPNDVRRWVSIFIVRCVLYIHIRARALWICCLVLRCQITRLIRHAKHPQTKRCIYIRRTRKTRGGLFALLLDAFLMAVSALLEQLTFVSGTFLSLYWMKI